MVLAGLKIKAKLGLLHGLSAMSLIAIIVLGASFLHHKMLSDREQQTKGMVEVARGVVQSWYEKEQTGSLTREQAQAGAIATLRPLRYRNNDYFFIQGYDGVPRLNPVRPEVEGQNRLSAAKDPLTGKLYLVEQIAEAKAGGGFSYYHFPRADSIDKEPLLKVSYIAGFEPWQWALGSGVYVDDIEIEFRSILIKLGLPAFAIFGIATLCAYLVSRNISTSLGHLKVTMEKLAAGDLAVEIDEADRRDEIGEMGKAMRVFKDNAVAARQLQAERERRRELEVEAALNHAQRLDALGRLAGGIAHDVNNALVPVLAITKLMISRFPKEGRDHRNLGIVLIGAQRVKELVQQVLSFSRKQTIEKRKFDPVPMVTDGIKMLRASVPTTIKFVSRINPVPPINGDPGQLHQVLINLVTNAAQAIDDMPGTITLILDVKDASRIRLTVSDTGAGMDEATKARIFEPFFTTKEVGKGTGLGLAVVHGIVSSHGGTITVQSVRGEGTRVEVLLPVAHNEPVAQSEEASAG
jgi:signal transduction histidine kinase